MSTERKRESWNSRTGVILAVAGSAVGLANFLQFPGQVAKYGGGAFMLAYVISLLLLALPMAWAEWTMGRFGGQKGVSSCPSILYSIWKKPIAKYLGILGVITPLLIYMYYAYVQSWCLGYAVNFITQSIDFATVEDSESFWVTFIGASENGSAIGFGLKQVGVYLIVAFAVNFTLIYRGVARGIEIFCRIAVPTLIIIGLVVLFRVLTLGAPVEGKPEQSINNGLGYMWNPTKVMLQESKSTEDGLIWEDSMQLLGSQTVAENKRLAESNPTQYRVVEQGVWDQLRKPKLWLAAASQVFFSLSVGLGLIITYASYMKKDDDVVLSSLSAASANEFCEVGIGGLISLPAAYAFLGAAGVASAGIFGLGFKALPMVFAQMPGGFIFGFLFFFLLFLAAVNAAISTLQPSIAFLEEHLNIGRKRSVAILGAVTGIGCSFVVYFSQGVMALDSLSFWVGNLMVLSIATTQIITFSWVWGIDEGFEETHRGAAITIPRIFRPITKYVAPLFLLIILSTWLLIDVLGIGGGSLDSHIVDLIGDDSTGPNKVALMSIGLIATIYAAFAIVVKRAKHYENLKNT